MSQQVNDPVHQPQPDQPTPRSKADIIASLVVIGLLLISLTGLMISSLAYPYHAAQRSVALVAANDQEDQGSILTPTPPIYTPGNKIIPPLQLPMGYSIIYEQQNNLYMVPSSGGSAQLLSTPGYVYNEAVRPILTPSGQLLYSGNGVWLMDIFGGIATRIASLSSNQTITSMALSRDGTTVAWSAEPIDGDGNAAIYAGPLTAPIPVYQQSTANCPCFRIFSFMNDPGKQGDDTLLLTDDQASNEGVQYGLWSLDLTQPASEPQQLMDETPLQGPLTLAPHGNTLLYAPDEGVVPNPTDGSVPVDIASLTYANSLSLTTLDGQPLTLHGSQVVLPEQHNLNNNADYHWVTTPKFTPDGHRLVYVEFSSDSQAPYDRHSALYTVQMSGSGVGLHAGRPRLLVTSTSLLMELGTWLNDHILIFYADGALYALDINNGAVTTVLQTVAYARTIAVVETAQP